MSSDFMMPTAGVRPGRERRAVPRVAVEGAFAAVLLDVGTDVVSLSRGDMTIVLPDRLEPGSVHEFCLALGASTVELTGAVRSATTLSPGQHRMGVEFTRVGERQRAVLDAFLSPRLGSESS